MTTTPVEMLHEYVDTFNAGDFTRLVEFYHDDLQLIVSRGTELNSKQAVVEHYTRVREVAQRTIRIADAFSCGDKLAAEFTSEFFVQEDDDDFPSGPVRAGDRLVVHTFVRYDLRDGLLWRGRSATFRRQWFRADGSLHDAGS